MVWINSSKAYCWPLCLIASLVLAISGETVANWQEATTLRGRDSWRESRFEAPMIEDQDQEEDDNKFDDDLFASRAAKQRTEAEQDALHDKMLKEEEERLVRPCSASMYLPGYIIMRHIAKVMDRFRDEKTVKPDCDP